MTELDPDEVRRLLEEDPQWIEVDPDLVAVMPALPRRLERLARQIIEDWLRLREENERLLALLRDMERSRPLILGVELRRRLNEILWQA